MQLVTEDRDPWDLGPRLTLIGAYADIRAYTSNCWVEFITIQFIGQIMLSSSTVIDESCVYAAISAPSQSSTE